MGSGTTKLQIRQTQPAIVVKTASKYRLISHRAAWRGARRSPQALNRLAAVQERFAALLTEPQAARRSWWSW